MSVYQIFVQSKFCDAVKRWNNKDYELSHNVWKVGNTHLIQEIFIINTNSVTNCNCFVTLSNKLFKNTLSRRSNDLEGKFTEKFEYQNYNLIPGICFESCTLQQVWPTFMNDNPLLWDVEYRTFADKYGDIYLTFIVQISQEIYTASSMLADLQNSEKLLPVSDWLELLYLNDLPFGRGSDTE